VGFQPNRRWGWDGEHAETGGRQKIQKKMQKNSKKTEKMKKWSQRTERDFDNFVVKKKKSQKASLYALRECDLAKKIMSKRLKKNVKVTI
jgi:hypothetical protein